MAGTFFSMLSLLSLATCLEVLFPAGGNIWDLDQVNSYQVLWKSAHSDPTHVHVTLHDAAGNVVDSYDSVKTSSGSYLISGLSEIPSGSDYRIVLSDSASPKRKIVARSGKFSIRQLAGSASSGISQDVVPTTTQNLPSSTTIVTTSSQTLSSVTGIVSLITVSVDSPIFTSFTSVSSNLQATSNRISSTSTTQSSFLSSTSTSISTGTSTGFPKYVPPSKGGLSMGAKVGIGVGLAILVLISFGVCVFFWRRRQRQHQEAEAWNNAAPEVTTSAMNDCQVAESNYHGKPELVGDPARLVSNGVGVGYVEKPELETHSSIVSGGESKNVNNEVQLGPGGMAELPQRGSSQTLPIGVVELSQQSQDQNSVPDRTMADIDSTPAHHCHGTAVDQPAPVDSTKNEVYRDQYQQAAAELPVNNLTRTDSNRPPSPQSLRAAKLSPPEELPDAFPIHLNSSQSPSSTRSVAPTAPSTMPAPLPPQDRVSNEKLEALRRRERNIAESISAAETIERLRREQFQIQEQIRIAEERAQIAGSSDKQ